MERGSRTTGHRRVAGAHACRAVALVFVAAACASLACCSSSPSWKAAALGPPPASEAAPGANAFAAALYAELRRPDENLVLSPLSMRLVLLMAYGGARGETAAEMARVLRVSAPEEVQRVAIATLRALRADDGKEGLALALASRLWGQADTPFRDEFLELVRDGYGAPLERLDLRAPEAAVGRINGWVADETKGLITDLLSPTDIGPATKLVLTNAVYFKGAWLEQFEEYGTRPSLFYRLDGSTRYVHMMMDQFSTAHYAEDDGVRLVELGYRGGSVGMVLAVPQERDGLPALEAKLSGEVLARWMGALEPRKVTVFLPRFELRSRLSMGQALRDMGLQRAFAAAADFSGMSPEPIWLEEALQASFVEVNESGTEAAASSALTAGGTGPGAPEPPVPSVVADRPFLFFIRHRPTGVVLFMGRVVDPCKDEPAACPSGPEVEPHAGPLDLDE